MTWPVFTRELKSALSDWIVPDTCDPVSTADLGSSTPLVSTWREIEPRVADAKDTVSAGRRHA